MNKSESIGALSAALAKAQGMMKAAIKDSQNPYFKQNYADLASVWEAAREPLSSNGLSIVQTLNTLESGAIEVETVLLHESGEWISGKASVTPAKQDAQGYGAVISYLRRYSLSAIIGGYAEDNDAEEDRKAGEGKEESKKGLSCAELIQKMESSENVFELENRAKKYRADYDKLTPEEQVKVRMAKDKRKVILQAIKDEKTTQEAM